MVVDKHTRDLLLTLYKEKRVSLEGNLLKVIEADKADQEFNDYLNASIEKDKESRKKRLEITKQIQSQNNELLKSQKENDRINKQLSRALSEAEQSRQDAVIAKEAAENSREEAVVAKLEAERAKDAALTDLDMAQKRSQFELIGTIVKVALLVIIGVGLITTVMYGIALTSDRDTQIIGSTWSNMFGILLTNAFSIVGTIMGVKYASEKNT